MGKTFEEIQKIKNEFANKYMQRPNQSQLLQKIVGLYNQLTRFSLGILPPQPDRRYMNMCGISKIRSMQQEQQSLQLREEETLDDMCISAGFIEQPPACAPFPQEYEGVRIFYKKIGVIRAF
ncbi:MAG: hypothetical protein Q7R96_00470 [Nanoarchaeota archaeon]|nr:hypothetical protein [Nanoarchaeota archaeon]